MDLKQSHYLNSIALPNEMNKMLCGSINTDTNGEICKNVLDNVDNDTKCKINITFCNSNSEILSDIA